MTRSFAKGSIYRRNAVANGVVNAGRPGRPPIGPPLRPAAGPAHPEHARHDWLPPSPPRRKSTRCSSRRSAHRHRTRRTPGSCSAHRRVIPPAVSGDLTSQQGHDLDLGLQQYTGPGPGSAHLPAGSATILTELARPGRSIPIRCPVNPRVELRPAESSTRGPMAWRARRPSVHGAGPNGDRLPTGGTP